ncbi:MAG: ATP-binding cassette domain-containing protein [Planctomycetota bacterium]
MVRIELVGVHLPPGPHPQLAERLVFDRGGINVVLGASASDGASCLDVIAGRVRPSRGRVLFDDCDVTRDGPVRRNVARAFAEPVVYPTLSVRANLELPLRRRRGWRQEASTRASDLADILGLQGALATRAGTLPAAERQLVALGRAFACADAAAILLDDPLAAVALPERPAARAAIVALAAEVRASVVWATGDVDDALTVAERVTVLAQGRVVQDGPPDDLLSAPATIELAAGIIDPPMNLLACAVQADGLRVGAARLDLPAIVAAARRVEGAGSLQLGVRADDLRIVAAPRATTLVAQLHAVEHRGAFRVASLRTDHLGLRVVCEVTQQLVPGYRYHVEIPAEAARLYADGVLVHG